MKKVSLVLPLTAAVLLLFSGAVLAQGGPPGGGGGFQMPPEMKKAMDDMKKWGESHKNVRQMGLTLRTMGEFDKDPKTALTKDQAKKIWGMVGPWKSKPVMTDAQAKTVNDGIVKVFTIPQIKKLASAQKEMQARMGGGGRGMGGGGGMGGGARPGGGGPPGGGAPGGGGGMGNFNPADVAKRIKASMKEYNPVNVNSYPEGFMKDRFAPAMTTTIKALEAKAK